MKKYATFRAELLAVIYYLPAAYIGIGLQNVINMPFESVAGRICELHAKPIVFCNTAGRNKVMIKDGSLILKSAVPKIIKAYPSTTL